MKMQLARFLTKLTSILTRLLQLVNNFQQASKIDNLEQVCGFLHVYLFDRHVYYHPLTVRHRLTCYADAS